MHGKRRYCGNLVCRLCGRVEDGRRLFRPEAANVGSPLGRPRNWGFRLARQLSTHGGDRRDRPSRVGNNKRLRSLCRLRRLSVHQQHERPSRAFAPSDFPNVRWNSPLAKPCLQGFSACFPEKPGRGSRRGWAAMSQACFLATRTQSKYAGREARAQPSMLEWCPGSRRNSPPGMCLRRLPASPAPRPSNANL